MIQGEFLRDYLEQSLTISNLKKWVESFVDDDDIVAPFTPYHHSNSCLLARYLKDTAEIYLQREVVVEYGYTTGDVKDLDDNEITMFYGPENFAKIVSMSDNLFHHSNNSGMTKKIALQVIEDFMNKEIDNV